MQNMVFDFQGALNTTNYKKCIDDILGTAQCKIVGIKQTDRFVQFEDSIQNLKFIKEFTLYDTREHTQGLFKKMKNMTSLEKI